MINKEKDYWLIIEGYVNIALKNKNLLLYNTLNGETLSYSNNDTLTELVHEIVNEENKYITKLSQNELNEEIVQDFIERLRGKFMGDVVETDLSDKRPVIFYPICNNQQEKSSLEAHRLYSKGENILINLREVTFYINSYEEKDVGYRNAYKQFLYPCFSNQKFILDYKLLEKTFIELANGYLSNINLLGGNIFNYNRIGELLKLLSIQSYKKTLFMRLSDLIDENSLISGEIVKMIDNLNESFVLNCIIDSYDNQRNNIEIIEVYEKLNRFLEYVFVVENEECLNEVEELINLTSIKTYRIAPFYNGNNIDFFEKFIYFDKEDILENKISQKTIFSNQALNRNHFGKITVMSNGDIYSNINKPVQGNLKKDTFKEIVYNEMQEGNSWKLNRTEISPCNNCVYELLCPSISNYEYVIGKMNLCHIWKS